MTFLFLISVANCHAQFMATGCAPANDLQFKDQGYLVGNPVIWAPGHSYTFTIDGTYSIKLRGYDGGCPDVAVSAWEWPAPWGPNPSGEGVGPAAQYIHLSNLTYVNPTLTTVTASVDADAPIGYIQLMLVGDADGYAFWGIDIKVPPPPPAPGPISPPQASCPTPAFAPVTATTPVSPSVWFAGKKYPIVITGTGFTTPAKATDSCPATQITVSVETGSVALSEVRVVDSTTITAVVEPAETDPAETAEVNLWGPWSCGECELAKRAANAAPMASSASAMASTPPVGPDGLALEMQTPANIAILKAVVADTSNIINGIVTVKLTGPSGTTGDLTLSLSGTTQNYKQTFPGLAPGSHTLKLTLPSVPRDTYDSVNGDGASMWQANVPGGAGIQKVNVPSSSFSKSWKFLGYIRFSQYNTPAEVGCAAQTRPMYVFDRATCSYLPTPSVNGKPTLVQLRSQFVRQTLMNGTGNAMEYGLLMAVDITDTQTLCPKKLLSGASSANTFVTVPYVTGSCNKQLKPNYSVATYPNPKTSGSPLACSNSLILDKQDNTTAYRRVVADKCPGCIDGNHIDSYMIGNACDPHDPSIIQLGNFYTSTSK
jgi:hypothetical protein